ncbi:MAG: MarR family transcriptional regulator [Actinomycetota bacterium]|nr:MarR family transcriptional regulator [Actinomycetota bacterium]
MVTRRWLDEKDQSLWLAYIDMSRQLAAGMERQLAGSGVSGADYQVLAPLSGAPKNELRPRDLVRSAGWERSRLAHQLGRMEARGLISREECADDARGTIVRMTPAGRAALRAAAPGHVEWVREHFVEVLTGEEKAMLEAVCQRIVTRLEEAAGGT